MYSLLERKFGFHRCSPTTAEVKEEEELRQDYTVKAKGCSINNRDTTVKIRDVTVLIVRRKKAAGTEAGGADGEGKSRADWRGVGNLTTLQKNWNTKSIRPSARSYYWNMQWPVSETKIRNNCWWSGMMMLRKSRLFLFLFLFPLLPQWLEVMCNRCTAEPRQRRCTETIETGGGHAHSGKTQRVEQKRGCGTAEQKEGNYCGE